MGTRGRFEEAWDWEVWRERRCTCSDSTPASRRGLETLEVSSASEHVGDFRVCGLVVSQAPCMHAKPNRRLVMIHVVNGATEARIVDTRCWQRGRAEVTHRS